MGPVKNFKSELERGITRAWESLTEGWREMLSRSSGALTHFVRSGKRDKGEETEQAFPQWGLLAGESWETAKSIIVRVEMPGMNKDDIEVSVHGSTLRIRGEKHASGEHSISERQGRLYHLMERAYGRFERTISLPQNVDGEQAEVTYRDGVITVILPKVETSPPRRLRIK